MIKTVLILYENECIAIEIISIFNKRDHIAINFICCWNNERNLFYP